MFLVQLVYHVDRVALEERPYLPESGDGGEEGAGDVAERGEVAAFDCHC